MCGPNASLKEVIMEMTSKRLGATAVVARPGIAGHHHRWGSATNAGKECEYRLTCMQRDIMSANTDNDQKDALAVEALEVITDERYQSVAGDGRKPVCGIYTFHDLMKEGII